MVSTTVAEKESKTVRTAVVQWKRCGIYRFEGPYRLFPPDKTLVCAGNKDVRICDVGDAGSPLTYNPGDREVMIGVLSFGSGSCKDNATTGLLEYYTKVPSLMGWLLKTVGPSDST